MKEGLKKTYGEFVSWVKYVREYKDNKDNNSIYDNNMIAKDKEIAKLKKNIENKGLIEKEKDDLIALLYKRIEALTNHVSNVSKRANELRNTVSKLYNENEKLRIEINGKDLLRRKYAGSVGGQKRIINDLKQELEKANMKIQWLSNNQKAPTKEEIKAYDLQMKEVEKRQKNGKSNNNI